MSQRFTREEFYDLVWTKPLTHLAKDFRLSDVALHKICRKHDIPNPPLGWWAKHAAGQNVKRIPLPKAKVGVALTVIIASGEVRQEPGSLASAREQARVKASELDLSGELLSHPLVQKSFDKLRKAKPGNTGLGQQIILPRLPKCQPVECQTALKPAQSRRQVSPVRSHDRDRRNLETLC